jgi:hypothetical protein
MIVPKYLIECDKCIIHTLAYIQQEHFIVPLIQMYLLNKETERERESIALTKEIKRRRLE